MEPTLSPLMLVALIFGLSITVFSWKVQSRHFVGKYANALRQLRKRLSPREAEWIGFGLVSVTVYLIQTQPIGLLEVGTLTTLACALGLYSISYDAYMDYRRKDREQRSHP